MTTVFLTAFILEQLVRSPIWWSVSLEHSNFNEPSLDAVDQYNSYEEDIDIPARRNL